MTPGTTSCRLLQAGAKEVDCICWAICSSYACGLVAGPGLLTSNYRSLAAGPSFPHSMCQRQSSSTATATFNIKTIGAFRDVAPPTAFKHLGCMNGVWLGRGEAV